MKAARNSGRFNQRHPRPPDPKVPHEDTTAQSGRNRTDRRRSTGEELSHITRPGQDRQQHDAESGSFRSRRLASLAAPLRVSSLRCGPLRGVESKTAGARHVGYSRRERTRSLIIGSRSSPCMYLFVSFLVSR